MKKNKIKGDNDDNFIAGTLKADDIDGKKGDDTIHADAGNDTVKGGKGNDYLYGDSGMDVLFGGHDDDHLSGGTENDLLDGGKGNDELFGDEGDDIIAGNKGSDTLMGGDGDDVLLGDGKLKGNGKGWGSDGGAGSGGGKGKGSGGGSGDGTGKGSGSGSGGAEWNKWATVGGSGSGGSGSGASGGGDYLDGGAGKDLLFAGAGNDTGHYQVTENVGSTDAYDGGDGIDTLELELTLDEWMDPAFQVDLASYLQFLEDHTDASSGEADDEAFAFNAFGLSASAWENLAVTVDGVATNPVDEAVTAKDDNFTAVEDGTPTTGNVLADNDNGADDIPDFLRSVSLDAGSAGTLMSLDSEGNFEYDSSWAYQHLAAGEVATDTFTYIVEDADGDTDTGTVSIEVTGTNDDPTLAAGSMGATEDGSGVALDLSALGDDVDSDNDGSNLAYALLNVATGGSASIAGTTLSFDPGSDFQSLAEGETTDFDLDVQATDIHGAIATNTATVTVTGVNDAPILAAGSMGATEDGPGITLDLSALGGDVDSDNDGSNLAYTLQNAATGGSASIAGTTLSFDPGSDFQSLAEGETTDFDLQLKATDVHGAEVLNTVTVTVTGVNDAPEIDGGDSTGAVTLVTDAEFTVEQWTNYLGSFSLDALQTAAGSVPNYTVTTDVIDFTDDPAGFSGEIPGSSPWPAAVATNASGTGGINDHFFARVTTNIVITETDNYTFRTFNDDGVYLNVNNQLIINDPTQHPEAAFEGSINLTPGTYPLELYFFENGGEASLELAFKKGNGDFQHVGPSSDSGTLLFSDVDLNDSHIVSVTPVGTVLGSLSAVVDVDTTGSGAGGEVDWSYQISNNAYQSLGAGATTTESFQISVSDNHSAVDTQQVDITITGSNDAPTGTAAASLVVGKEDIPYTVNASDLLDGFSDIDVGDILSVSGLITSDGSIVDNLGGTFTITPTPDFNGVVNLNYNVVDGNGGSVPATQSYTVVDVPKVSALIDFEDLPRKNGGGLVISDDYKGFNWHTPVHNLSLLDGDLTGIAGYAIAGTNVAYAPHGNQPIEITRSDNSDFDFESVDLIAAWEDWLTLEFNGYKNGELLHTGSITVDNKNVTHYSVAWDEIDQLEIVVVGSSANASNGAGDHLVLDNFIFAI